MTQTCVALWRRGYTRPTWIEGVLEKVRVKGRFILSYNDSRVGNAVSGKSTKSTNELEQENAVLKQRV